MSPMDIILTVVLIILVVTIIYFQIKRAKKLGGGCSGCSGCSKRDSCPSNKEKRWCNFSVKNKNFGWKKD